MACIGRVLVTLHPTQSFLIINRLVRPSKPVVAGSIPAGRATSPIWHFPVNGERFGRKSVKMSESISGWKGVGIRRPSIEKNRSGIQQDRGTKNNGYGADTTL